IATLGLTGRPALRYPYDPYVAHQLHIPPATWRFDPTGREALDALDRALDEAGPENVAAFFIEPVSAAALPGYTPPEAFWRGLAERRDRHGFLICLDEILTGMGRTGAWFAAHDLPIEVDVITTAKGLGAGYAPVGAVICHERCYQAIAEGSRAFEHGHTWDGAPQFAAVGLAVLDVLEREGLVERVRERGPALRDDLAAVLEPFGTVGEVRGRGFLLGVEFVDPRDGSILPDELKLAPLVDSIALEHGLLVTSAHPNADGYASDQTLLAPAYTATDEELGEMVERFAATVADVESRVEEALAAPSGP
ncbi:MAG: aminotransferase class III-fold pyridoxal phosphate-dependent enzyme, partial [Actinobacteria bacterium]|nr:aminotransferase class III-fold pyridoxal phosphate-dependent enzyme [Actinomycetota bacterium]